MLSKLFLISFVFFSSYVFGQSIDQLNPCLSNYNNSELTTVCKCSNNQHQQEERILSETAILPIDRYNNRANTEQYSLPIDSFLDYVEISDSIESENGESISTNTKIEKYRTPNQYSSVYFFREKGKEASTNKRQASLPVIKLGFEYYNKSNLKLHRQTAISFKKGNSFGFNYGYDSAMYDVQPTDMYWELEEGKKWVITGVQEISDDLEVPFVIAIDSDKPTYLMLDSQSNINRSIFIEDKVAKKTYDLSSGLIELKLDKGIYKNRFYLKFKNNASENSGIITANTLWLRADENVTGGADVTSWKSRTNASVDFQGFGTPNNTVTSNNLNFNPVITFVPGDGDYLSYTGNLNPRTVYMVYNDTSTSSWITPFTNNDGQGIGHGETNDTGIFSGFTPIEVRNGLGHVNGSVTSLTSYDRPDNYALISNRYTANISNGSHIYTVARDRTNANRLMNGNIAEIMVFSDAHSSIKRKQIESYLAIKYGFTLSNNTDGDASVNEDIGGSIKEGDYILADNTKVWDSESAYHHDVAGIGRYDQMGLYQKQSKSVNSDAIITIGLNTIAATNALNANTINADEDFLMWGNNNGVINTVSTSELVCAPEVTLGRTWKIVEKGVVGSVELTATKSVIDGALNTANTIKVLKIADDANFTNNVTYIPLTDKTVNGENVYSATYDFNGTKYFTYTEVNGIFWSGTSSTWIGGNGSNNQASLNAADTDKVMIVDAFGTNNHATLSENAKVECVWIKENSKLMVSNDKYLEFDEKFILDGEIRLIGKAQLLQTHSGTTNVEGNGKLYIDQQSNIKGTNGIYRYNYWSSPVVGTLNATSYKVGEIMKDGTTPTSENSQVQDINFVSSYDGNASSTPITVSEHWIWSYLNGTTRSNWSQKKSTGDLLRGQGFIMKGTGATNGQNYTFVGTPNSGNISFPISANASSLLGNPYPSTLDSDAFIEDNPSTTGSLYFWEHTGEVNTTGATNGHNKFRYEGGYAVRTKGVGVAANSVSTNTGTGTGTYHIPSQYMAVGQGFFVTGNGTGGTITFNNAQRKYNGFTYFFRKKGKVASTNKGQASLPVIKLGFDYYNKSNVKLHRQIAISFKKGNTFGFDYGYDSAMFDVRPTDMYWELEEGKKWIIAGVQEISDALEVPVVIAIDSDKPTHLMLDSHIHINRSVFIEDKVAKKTYDLSSGAVELDLAKGVYKNRFYLKFKKGSVLDVDKEILDGELTVFVDQNKKELVISNANNLMVEKVDIYTILGQNFQNWKLHKNLKEIRLDVGSFSSAVYVLKIKTNKGVLSKKVIIQK